MLALVNILFLCQQRWHPDKLKEAEAQQRAASTSTASDIRRYATGLVAGSSIKPGSATHQAVTKALMRWVGSGYVPLSMVDNEAFKEFLELLNPS